MPRRYRDEIEAWEAAKGRPMTLSEKMTAYYRKIDPSYRPLFGPGGRYEVSEIRQDPMPWEIVGHFADDPRPVVAELANDEPVPGHALPESDGWYPPPPGGTWCVAHGPTCGQEPQPAPVQARPSVLDLLPLLGATPRVPRP